MALHDAKQRRVDVAVYNPQYDPPTRERLSLMSALRQALRTTQLELYYQPKISAQTGTLYGVEALLRWHHPVHGFMPPDRFIPLAESTGVIVPLTTWVLDAALRQCSAWAVAGHRIGVAVNVSARLLQEVTLPETVAGLLARHGVAPETLTIEITESGLMADPQRARTILEGLHAQGVRLSIDDFGTGYSSLGYLKDLPVDEVKIDKSFVMSMQPDETTGNTAIVCSVIAMAHALGLDVVAEGVEREEIAAFLTATRCDLLQGYYFTKPLPAAALQEWVSRDPAAYRSQASA